MHGAVFYDLQATAPYHLDAYSASVKDGMGKELHRRIFVLQSLPLGQMAVRQPTLFLDLSAAPSRTAVPANATVPDAAQRENALIEQCLAGFVKGDSDRSRARRPRSRAGTYRSVWMSSSTGRILCTPGSSSSSRSYPARLPWLAASMKQCEDRLDELNSRRERRTGGTGAGKPVRHRRHPAHRLGVGAPASRARNGSASLHGAGRGDRADRRASCH